MATKKILTDLEIGGKIGVNQGTPVASVDIVETALPTTGTSYGVLLDMEKSSSTTSYDTDAYGLRSYVKATTTGTNQITNVNALWTKAEHTGTGNSYFLIGASNRSYHTGAGNTNGMYGGFLEARISGTGVSSHNYVIGADIVSDLQAANANVNFLQGSHISVKMTTGAIDNDISVVVLDFDVTGGTVAGDLAYVYVPPDTIGATVTGTERMINSESLLPSVFAGSIESTSFIKTSGVATEFLKADGSVDTNTYLTSADHKWDDATGGINYSGGNVGVGDTSPSRQLTLGGAAPVLSLHSTSLTGESSIYFGDTEDDNEGRIIYSNSQDSMRFWVAAAEAVRIDSSGDVGIGTADPLSKLHVKASNSGATAAANATLLVEAGSAPSIQILSANTQTQFIKFGDPQDGDAGGISYSHATNKMNLRTNGGDKVTIDPDGDVGIGNTSPQTKLDVSGCIRMGDDSTAASAATVGAMRYRVSGTFSYFDMVMQTIAGYEWVNVVRNDFNV